MCVIYMKSYAEVVMTPAPSATYVPRTLGRPVMRLPISQLLPLGRTAPPWHGSAWKLGTATIVDGCLRVPMPGFTNFRARPAVLPALDATIKYKVRFSAGFRWTRGRMPGLVVGSSPVHVCWERWGLAFAAVTLCRALQTRAYKAAVPLRGAPHRSQDRLFGGAHLRLHPGRWNQIVLRIKMNGFEGTSPKPDGVLTLSINGSAATCDDMVWRTDPRTRIEQVSIVTDGSTCEDAYVEYDEFCVVT